MRENIDTSEDFIGALVIVHNTKLKEKPSVYTKQLFYAFNNLYSFNILNIIDLELISIYSKRTFRFKIF